VSDRYASHLNVLTTVLNTYKPKRILEYGSGRYSTPLFLARPHVEKLHVVETDFTWRRELVTNHKDDRMTVLVEGNPPPSSYDLIFIDDGISADQRCRTIRAVLSRPHPVVVIHDAEVPEYRELMDELADEVLIYRTDPDTAVIP
jgi:predicted O-methyltransferase YrrM